MPILDAIVLDNLEPTPGYRELVLRAPEAAAAARPGQFLHLLCGDPPCGDGAYRYLRRPVSLFRADRSAGTVSVLFRVLGEGTRWLAARRAGETVNALGPLGRGFPLDVFGEAGVDGAAGSGDGPAALVVGGGVGIPPLFFLARELRRRGVPVRAILGARSAADLLAEADFARAGVPVDAATDDGSRGWRGLVTDLLAGALDAHPEAVVFACGPLPMLRAVQGMAAGRAVPAYLSVEERMACGVGACLGCPVRVTGDDPYPAGAEPWAAPPRGAALAAAYERLARAGRGEAPTAFRRACVEGPVFPAWEVVLA